MKNTYLRKSDVFEFVEHLKKFGKVFAPKNKGQSSFSFGEVEKRSEVILDYPRTLQSIKKYFFPSNEKILSFETIEQNFEKVKFDNSPKIFFGLHSYDMQALLKLDYNFSQGKPEMNYLSRRKNCSFIGVSFEPDEYHFTRSVGVSVEAYEGFDLFMNKNKTGYNINVITDRGRVLIEGFDKLEKVKSPENTQRQFKNNLKFNFNRIPEVFDHSWNSKIWDAVAQRCVGCSTCNLVCPTCYCFSVEDNLDISLETGIRERRWDGCTLESFAVVAGGENFRDSNAKRQRHRLFRKFKYITDITGTPWCVGCGRCTAYCTAGISIVDIVNELCEEYERNHLVPRFPENSGSNVKGTAI
jgi:sulfhydrogenase subunit beta (sulfur reductase)